MSNGEATAEALEAIPTITDSKGHTADSRTEEVEIKREEKKTENVEAKRPRGRPPKKSTKSKQKVGYEYHPVLSNNEMLYLQFKDFGFNLYGRTLFCMCGDSWGANQKLTRKQVRSHLRGSMCQNIRHYVLEAHGLGHLKEQYGLE